MSDILQTNIFFFITAVAVIVVGVAWAIALYYLIGILRDARVIAKKIRKASDEIEQDFEAVRSQIKTEGYKLKAVIDLLVSFLSKKFRPPSPRAKKKASEDDMVE